MSGKLLHQPTGAKIMSNVIELLERLGKCGNGSESVREVLDNARCDGEISTDLLAAVATGDHAQLSMKLGTRTKVYCAVFPAKQDEEEQDDQEQDDDKESPDDKTAKGFARNDRRVAFAS
jgi:hypothetical protein